MYYVRFTYVQHLFGLLIVYLNKSFHFLLEASSFDNSLANFCEVAVIPAKIAITIPPRDFLSTASSSNDSPCLPHRTTSCVCSLEKQGIIIELQEKGSLRKKLSGIVARKTYSRFRIFIFRSLF